MKGTSDLSTADARERLLKALVESALESDLARCGVRRGCEDLPRRWLPHGSYHDLYTLYCAHQAASNEKVASSTTFYRVLCESGWKKKIKFSPPSAHSKCTICFALKSKIRHAKGIAEQTDASDKLLRHLAGQYADRAVYHELRNRAKTTGDIICCITDSMDKSKFSLPRYQRGQAPKDVATVDRPSLEVTTTLVHGVGVFTYLGDENQTAGTNWVLETLTRSLQHTWIFFKKQSKPQPGVLKIFSDNTPKEPLLGMVTIFFVPLCCLLSGVVRRFWPYFIPGPDSPGLRK